MEDKEILKIYHEKKIFYVRLELIRDFLFYLLDIVDRTYLGDDLMTIQNKNEHFKYSVDKTVKFYDTLDINFNITDGLLNFLFDIFFKYYYDTKKTKKNIFEFKSRLSLILCYSLRKKESQVKELVTYYDMFHISLGDYLIF